jgi:regulator of sigma E protease
VEGTPAALAGLQSGDKITHINGSRVHLFEDLGIMLANNGGQPIDLRIRRDGRAQTLTLTPHLNDDGVYRMGFYPVRRTGLSGELTDGLTRISLWESISIAFNHIIFFIKMTILFLVQLITRAGPTPEVVGIVGFFDIIETTYQVTLEQSASFSLTTSQLFTQMLTRMLTLCALLSANLGIFNLLPLPALDGGRLVFLTLEGIRRKPVSQEKESLVHLVGFALLIGLAIFITYQDILKRL